MQKTKKYCPACGVNKQAKFFRSEEHRYCNTCCNKKPELKKWRMRNGYCVKV